MSILLRTLIKEILLEAKAKKTKVSIEDKIKESTDILDQFVNKGYFIHFTDDYKLQGLNVSGNFDTPLGIYTYPFTNQFYKDGEINVPFAGDRKYIMIYELISNQKFVKSSTYSDEDLINDGHKLGFSDKQIDLTKEIAKENTDQEIAMARLMVLLYANIKDEQLQNVEFELKNAKKATFKLIKLGYAGMFDDLGLGIIHSDEPTQAFFVNSKVCTLVKVVNNPEFFAEEHRERMLAALPKILNNDKNFKEKIIEDPHKTNHLDDEHLNMLLNQLSEDELKNIIQNSYYKAFMFIRNIVFKQCFKLTTEFQVWVISFLKKNYHDENVKISNDAFQEIIKQEFKINNENFVEKNKLNDGITFDINDKTISNESLNSITKYFQFSSKEVLNKFIENDKISIIKYMPSNVFVKKAIEGIKKNDSLDQKFVEEMIDKLTSKL